jgi:hypothetical protein
VEVVVVEIEMYLQEVLAQVQLAEPVVPVVQVVVIQLRLAAAEQVVVMAHLGMQEVVGQLVPVL